MNLYLVPTTGTGSADDPIRPDVPADTSWVGQPHGGVYLLATRAVLPAAPGRSGSHRPDSRQVRDARQALGVTAAQLDTWRAG